MKGHIRERSPGHWAIILDVRDATTGKRRRRWHSFHGTKRQAQIECARLISEMKGGTYVEPSKMTLAQFLERWLDNVKPRISPRTHERYTEIVRKNIIPALGAIHLIKLRPAQIAGAYSDALASGRRNGRGGLAPTSVIYMHRIIKQSLGQAVRWELLARNPADAVDPPKAERRTLTTYDIDQTAELLELLRGTRLRLPVLIAVMCGCRRGEIVALRWKHVDLDAGKMAIVESAEQTAAGVRYKPPKSGKGRSVTLSEMVVAELREHRLAQAEELLAALACDAHAGCRCTPKGRQRAPRAQPGRHHAGPL
jgi:integrase